MAQWLKALSVLSEDGGSVPSTPIRYFSTMHILTHTICTPHTQIKQNKTKQKTEVHPTEFKGLKENFQSSLFNSKRKRFSDWVLKELSGLKAKHHHRNVKEEQTTWPESHLFLISLKDNFLSLKIT